MGEYRSLAFMVVSSDGTVSKLVFDKDEGLAPNVSIKGDRDLLLKRWYTISQHVERILKEEK